VIFIRPHPLGSGKSSRRRFFTVSATDADDSEAIGYLRNLAEFIVELER
jgi:hypothetical protein